VKELFYIGLPILLILDMVFRFIMYKLDKRLKKANDKTLVEMNKTLIVFQDVQAFILEKLKEDTNEK